MGDNAFLAFAVGRLLGLVDSVTIQPDIRLDVASKTSRPNHLQTISLRNRLRR